MLVLADVLATSSLIDKTNEISLSVSLPLSLSLSLSSLSLSLSLGAEACLEVVAEAEGTANTHQKGKAHQTETRIFHPLHTTSLTKGLPSASTACGGRG